eukprot:6178198-Pleurochrysis_carterae.AAC.2
MCSLLMRAQWNGQCLCIDWMPAACSLYFSQKPCRREAQDEKSDTSLCTLKLVLRKSAGQCRQTPVRPQQANGAATSLNAYINIHKAYLSISRPAIRVQTFNQ